MRILALNAYHGGSHKAFLDGWIANSRHDFDVMTLPAYKWKWRMRHAAVTFAEQLADRVRPGWDMLFCTDMLNLAEFLGLAGETIRSLPSIAYFHENQLTYPNRQSEQRDLHFAFTNVTTCLAAKAVWFNSAFHRDSFLGAVAEWMERMPDFQLFGAVDAIRQKASVLSPGIDIAPRIIERAPGPLRLVWVSRWEHDKNPQLLFDALALLEQRRVDFRLSVLGESFGQVPDCFADAKSRFADRIDRWGYAESRGSYIEQLHRSDVVISTAVHEFFGIGVLEAVAAGCFPLVPRALAYPEVLGVSGNYFHDGTVQGISNRLFELSRKLTSDSESCANNGFAMEVASRFAWPVAAGNLDQAVERYL